MLGKLKSDPALSAIPVIMLTIVDERTMGYSLGAAEYMTKPVDRNRLLELLRRFAASAGEAVVLVVDDSEDVRAVVRQTVEKSGLKTVEAENGQAALDWLAANPVAGAGAARSDDAGDGRLHLPRSREDDPGAGAGADRGV